jgi:hypothetical protein
VAILRIEIYAQDEYERIAILRRRTDVLLHEREKMNGWEQVKRSHNSGVKKRSINPRSVTITLASIFLGASLLSLARHAVHADNARVLKE